MAIAENIDGLGGFSLDRRVGDLRSGQSRNPLREVMTVHAAFRKYPWLINLVLLLLTIYVIVGIMTRPRAPVEVLSGEISPAIVKGGDPVHIKYVVNRNQICQNTILARWESEHHDPTPITLPMRTNIIPKMGQNLPVFLTLAAPMETGRQCYISDVTHRCTNGNYIVSTPELCVMVTP